ncbi:MAG TPA: DJ-1/PfpI family protein [Candidatus Binatia bacterium]|nr:DJ-1/PfpI family protein [Candidatus Binatia bacterium]
MAPPRRIAFLVFPRLTFLDLVGVHDALRRVPDVALRLIGTEATVADESGMRILADGVYEDLGGFDLLVVPGGLGTRTLVDDPRCIEYLRGWGTVRPLASVCTGALLIGKAGHLAGLRATTNHGAVDLLRPFCREVAAGERVVDEGRLVTAAGVSASLDLGLHLVEKFWGAATRRRVGEQMEYPPTTAR